MMRADNLCDGATFRWTLPNTEDATHGLLYGQRHGQLHGQLHGEGSVCFPI